jgi:hypothetical protein
MTASNDPWSEIPRSNKDNALNRIRADASHPLDFWYARDFQGRYIFYLDAKAEIAAADTLPHPAGMEVTAFDAGNSICRLVLTLTDSTQIDIFRVLCSDLIKATADVVRNEGAGLSITLTRLVRWQEMLKKARTNILTSSQIIGLIGELTLFKDILLPNLSAFDAANSWRGPYGDEQDFLLAGSIIEVKTQLSTSDQYLNISSEHQLDTASGPILICHQTLDVPSSDDPPAASLNGLIQAISAEHFSLDTGARDLFESGLIEAGYILRPEYDRPFYLRNTRAFYEVRDTFPSISPAILPLGVERVRYRISITACKEFALTQAEAERWLFDD